MPKSPIENGSALLRVERVVVLTDNVARKMCLNLAAKMAIEEAFRDEAKVGREPGNIRAMVTLAYCLTALDRMKNPEKDLSFAAFCELLPDDDDDRMLGLGQAVSACMGLDKKDEEASDEGNGDAPEPTSAETGEAIGPPSTISPEPSADAPIGTS